MEIKKVEAEVIDPPKLPMVADMKYVMEAMRMLAECPDVAVPFRDSMHDIINDMEENLYGRR